MLIYQRVQEKKNIFWFQGRLWHQVVCKVWSGSSTRGNPRNPPNSAQNLGSLSEVHWWSNDFRHVYSTRIADWVHVRSFWDQSFSFTHVNKWIYTYIYIYIHNYHIFINLYCGLAGWNQMETSANLAAVRREAQCWSDSTCLAPPDRIRQSWVARHLGLNCTSVGLRDTTDP